MPEGDTVWRQARDLDRVLAGQPLLSSDFRVPAFATLDLSGQSITEVQARGKHLLMHLGQLVIHSHLSMEGHWDIYPLAEPLDKPQFRRPAHAARAILRTNSSLVVGFSLGKLEVLSPADALKALSHLGPDLLGPDWNGQEAQRRLLADPQRPIGLALLDQHNLAGIGNIYRNELCFLGGVNPHVAVGQVPTLERILDLAKRLLEANKGRSKRSTTGGPASNDAAVWVYGRAGKPCKRCGARIQHEKMADPAYPVRAARDIYFCPRCQPLHS